MVATDHLITVVCDPIYRTKQYLAPIGGVKDDSPACITAVGQPLNVSIKVNPMDIPGSEFLPILLEIVCISPGPATFKPGEKIMVTVGTPTRIVIGLPTAGCSQSLRV